MHWLRKPQVQVEARDDTMQQVVLQPGESQFLVAGVLDAGIPSLPSSPFHTRKASPRRAGSPNSPGRPATRQLNSRGTARESVSSSKLFRDISPTRLYAQTQQEVMLTSLPELFRQKQGLESLRPTYSLEYAAKPEEGACPPKLLQRLQEMLSEKLRVLERLPAKHGFAAMQMRADAHRQVFDAFLHSFTTYRSLLLRIKREYDAALDDAMASIFDNVHMSASLGMTEQHMDAAMEAARQQALTDAAVLRKEVQDEIEEQDAVARDAEHRCQHAEQELQNTRSNIAQLQQEAARLTQHIAETRIGMLSSSSFSNPTLLARLEPGRHPN